VAEIPKSWVVYGAAGVVGLVLLTGLVVVLTLRPVEQGTGTSEPVREFVFPDSGTKGPGERILQGANLAFETKYFPTALKFYKDFELRYAGSEAYEAHIPKVWDQMIASDQASPQRDPTLPEYVSQRRGLHDEWKRLKARPRGEARDDLRKFAAKLPPEDGRRAIVEGWLAETAEKK
jgi:hypothetical protein